MLLDILVLLVPFFVIGIIGGLVTAASSSGSYSSPPSRSVNATLAVWGVALLLQAVYFAAFNGLGTGQTPGNRAPGIAVRDARTGEAIGFWRGLLRWLVRAVLYAAFVIPGLVNDLFPLWTARRQTIADMAAGSVMVKLK